jgi:hypothetical protein
MDWVLANCRTQKAFCSPENAMFSHHCLLAEKRVTTPSHLSQKYFYISSIRWHAFISYMWVCYCTAKPLNPGWTYETRCIICKTFLLSITNARQDRFHLSRVHLWMANRHIWWRYILRHFFFKSGFGNIKTSNWCTRTSFIFHCFQRCSRIHFSLVATYSSRVSRLFRCIF